MINIIFAIDPGNVSGWAVITVEAEPKRMFTDKVDFAKFDPFDNPICAYNEILDEITTHDHGFTHTAIEGQYLDKGKKQNVDSLIKLSRKAGRWEEAACAHGLTYEYIQPSVWIAAELGPRLRRDQIAILAKQKCEALYGVKGLSEHEYCAILIGRYVAIREWRKSLLLTTKADRERG